MGDSVLGKGHREEGVGERCLPSKIEVEGSWPRIRSTMGRGTGWQTSRVLYISAVMKFVPFALILPLTLFLAFYSPTLGEPTTFFFFFCFKAPFSYRHIFLLLLCCFTVRFFVSVWYFQYFGIHRSQKFHNTRGKLTKACTSSSCSKLIWIFENSTIVLKDWKYMLDKETQINILALFLMF